MTIKRLHGNSSATGFKGVITSDLASEVELFVAKITDLGSNFVDLETGASYVVVATGPASVSLVRTSNTAAGVKSSATSATQVILIAGAFQPFTGLTDVLAEGGSQASGRWTMTQAGLYQFIFWGIMASAPNAGDEVQMQVVRDPDGAPTVFDDNTGLSITNFGASKVPYALDGLVRLDNPGIVELQIQDVSATGNVVFQNPKATLVLVGS